MTEQSSLFPFSLGSQAEQERLQYAILAAQVGTWHLDFGRQQVWWDERCQELFGFRGSNVIAYNQMLALVHEEDWLRFDGAVKSAFDPSSSGYYDVQFRTVGARDGQIRWLQCQGRAYIDVFGAAYRLSGVVRDITAQVQLHQQLELSKARFRSIVLNSPTPTVLFLGRDMVIDTVNVPMLQIWQKDASVTGQPLYQVMPELVNPPLLDLLQRIYDTGESYHDLGGKATVVIDGQWQDSWFNFSYNPVYTPDGTIFGLINTATDVTGEVLALQQLQQSEVRFRALIEEAPVATCLLVGRDLRIEVANETILAVCGRQKEVMDQPLVKALPELQDQPFLHILHQILETGDTYADQGVRADLLVDGIPETFYVDITAKPLFDDQGSVYAILVMATDVTRQVLAQQVIQHSEEQKTFLLQLTDQLRTLPESDEIYERAARLLGQYLGVERVGFVQKQNQDASLVVFSNFTDGVDNWQGRYQPADYLPVPGAAWEGRMVVRPDVANDQTMSEEQKEAYQARQLGATIDKPLVTKNGSVIVLFVHSRTARHWTANDLVLLDEVAARLVIAVERAEAEQALRESEQQYRILSEELEHRVEERTQELVQVNIDLKRSNDNLQQFAYIASHDLQEPLRKIQAFGDVLLQQDGQPLDDQSRFLLQRMVEAGNRMSTLVSDLLTFSRIQTPQEAFGEVSLQAIVARVLDTLDLVVEQSGARIEVSPLPRLSGDEMQLGQLFQNLLSNALKFTLKDRPPVIVVRAEERLRTELPAHVRPGSTAERFYQIDIIDNGIGFDSKYLDRIFRVFQRLHGKSQYPGTGIGLAICQRVVENHGGAITADSQPGQGATFSVFLPF